MADSFNPLPLSLIRCQVSEALAEDVGTGDLTADLIPASVMESASILAREAGVLCGQDWVNEVFFQIDPLVQLRWHKQDGERFAANTLVCELQGSARALLTGERTALNFLQTLSGTATQTSQYVAAVEGYPVRILDTRKTIPGLRQAQKYAVRCGGGSNHRLGLFDAILIKENHIAACGSIAAVMQQSAGHGVETEIEVESLDELRQALAAGAKRIMLDNFNLADMRNAVALTAGRARLEVSGNVSLETIAAIAATGIDDISIGALTKHVQALDFSMRFGARN